MYSRMAGTGVDSAFFGIQMRAASRAPSGMVIQTVSIWRIGTELSGIGSSLSAAAGDSHVIARDTMVPMAREDTLLLFKSVELPFDEEFAFRYAHLRARIDMDVEAVANIFLVPMNVRLRRKRVPRIDRIEPSRARRILPIEIVDAYETIILIAFRLDSTGAQIFSNLYP